MLAHARTHLASLHAPPPDLPLPPPLQPTLSTLLSILTPSLLETAPPCSVLLLGPHASGKTLLTTHLLHRLRSAAHPDADLEHISLHGLLHAPPLKAWRAVAAQIAPLHAPDDPVRMNVQQCLGLITSAFQTFKDCSVPVVITLDAFDRFVIGPDAAAQTVLYSLLNFLQDSAVRVVVVAMTACVDVDDALEKRVKSRFNHRQIVVPLPEGEQHVLEWIAHILLAAPKNTKIYKQYAHFVNTFLAEPRCIHQVKRQLMRTRVVTTILSAIDAAVLYALEEGTADLPRNPSNTVLLKYRVNRACHMLQTYLQPRGAVADYLPHLTELEITFLLCLKKLEVWAEAKDAKLNIVFSDVFAQYQTASAEQGWGSNNKTGVERSVATKSWDKLIDCGLVVRIGHGPRDMRTCFLAVSPEQVDHALKHHPVASASIKKWATKSWTKT